jgi:hypothetical protein
MKTESIRPTIVIFAVATLFFAFVIPAGQPRYRLKERILAMEAYTMNPSKSTKATEDDEFARLYHHEAIMSDIFIPSVLLVNAAVIYFFWNYGKRERTADAP